MKWLLIALGLIVTPAFAEELRSVQVNGTSEVSVVPDRARITVGVNVVQNDPTAAMAELASKSSALVEAIKSKGIEGKDIQTSQLSLRPHWVGDKNEGFEASNNLSIEVATISELPNLLEALTEAGMNDLGGLEFISSEADAKEREAMLLAVEDARARAEALAAATGMKLGDPISIDYNSGGGSPRPMMMAKAASMEMSDMAVEAGSVGISSNVNIRYELLAN